MEGVDGKLNIERFYERRSKAPFLRRNSTPLSNYASEFAAAAFFQSEAVADTLSPGRVTRDPCVTCVMLAVHFAF